MDTENLDNKIVTRGLSGLNNIGNTCYMNSVIQSLSSTNLFCYYFRKALFKEKLHRCIIKNLKKKSDKELSKKKIKHKFKTSITYRLYQVLKIMWSINCELKPEKFKLSIDKLLPKFRGLMQHDAQEFLTYLLDQIHEENKSDIVIKKVKLNSKTNAYIGAKQRILKQIEEIDNEEKKETLKLQLKQLVNNNYIIDTQYEGIKFYESFLKNNHSIITDLFYGIFMSEICCNNCSNKSVTFEPFNMLQLELFNIENLSLEKMLQHYLKSEEINYKCDECKTKSGAMKRTIIHTLPEKLIIQFKRFISNGNHSRKNNMKVLFPFSNLEISEHIKQEPSNYELYSVINHMGDVGGGHYTNYSKNSLNNSWYEFNDSRVSYLNYPEKEIMTSSAYVLLYQKQHQ
jgi:ubiquitin carboxyl-terminal hydrolase 8